MFIFLTIETRYRDTSSESLGTNQTGLTRVRSMKFYVFGGVVTPCSTVFSPKTSSSPQVAWRNCALGHIEWIESVRSAYIPALEYLFTENLNALVTLGLLRATPGYAQYRSQFLSSAELAGASIMAVNSFEVTTDASVIFYIRTFSHARKEEIEKEPALRAVILCTTNELHF